MNSASPSAPRWRRDRDVRRPLAPAPSGYPIKLVRDNTPEIVNSTGEPGDLWYEEAGYDERLLRLKLAEEVGEFLVDGGIGELVDVLAVIEALATEHGTDLDALCRIVADDPRGGFNAGVVMYGRHDEYDRAGETDKTEADAEALSPKPSRSALRKTEAADG